MSIERSVLGSSKDEYAIRLVKVLSPEVYRGITDIFNEAVALCVESGEPHKYLMTFQNFLSRIPSWSQETVVKEADRIVEDSKCEYIQELLACVHVAHLKILTSIRPSEVSREVEIPLPKMNAFIHRTYINAARKLWQNTFLFETGILPLEQQKNSREVNIVIHDSIMDAVRESLPVDKILKNYLQGMEEQVEISIPAKVATQAVSAVSTPMESVQAESPVSSIDTMLGTVSDKVDVVIEPIKNVIQPIVTATELGQADTVDVVKSFDSPSPAQHTSLSGKPKVGFNNSDAVLDMGTNKVDVVEAPKDLTSLANKTIPIHGAAFPDDDDDSLTISAAPAGSLAGLIEEL
jgi:hypothetical protein